MTKVLSRSWFKIIAFFLFLLGGSPLWAQPAIPIGTWRTHFSYQQISRIETAGTRIYCAAQNGLFYFDKSDNSLNVLSKTDGLSDVGVSAMAYQASSDALLIAYRSGIVDLLSGNRIVSFTLIREADSGEQINHIYFSAHTVYLSTSEGVRVLDIITGEDGLDIQIRESYTNLSKTGDRIAIFSSTIAHDSLFLATEEGIIASSLSPQTNRQDFRSWRRFGIADGIPSVPIHFVASFADQVFAGIDHSGLYRYASQTWQLTSLRTNHSFRALNAKEDILTLVLGGSVMLYDSAFITTIENPLITQPHDAMVDAQGTLWIGDQANGLVRKQDSAFTNFYPQGPGADLIGTLRYIHNRTIALKAETAITHIQGAFYVFEEGRWINYTSSQNLPLAAPLLDVVYDPASKNYYFASFGSGIIRWDGQKSFNFITADNNGVTLPNNQITSLAINRKNDLWITSFNTAAALHTFNLSDNTWRGFSLNQPEASYPLKMILAEDDNPWILLNDSPHLTDAGNDIMVFNPENEIFLFLKDELSSAAWPGEEITDIIRDRNGQIWVGGSEGVAYFPNPWGVFSEVSIVKPIFESQFLLLGEYITAIAVDGGNRKWIGSRNGLWLFDETGETLISHFTTGNSPLVSNVILDISVNDADGEVFIATDQGLVSYRGTGSEGKTTHQSVKIFPNPVMANFSGVVGIQGLVSGATVKITNISGTLVRQLEAVGGTATWDIRDYRGTRVTTGIYLVFSASADGAETFVGKVAVID